MKELTTEEVKGRLKEKGVTQAEVADNLNLKPNHINMVVAGTRTSQKVLNFLSLIFGEDITIQRKIQRRKAKRILV